MAGDPEYLLDDETPTGDGIPVRLRGVRLQLLERHAPRRIAPLSHQREIMIQTLEWTDQGVRFIDQTKLPTEETYVTAKTYDQVADAIRTMIVRGAPAIGVAAGMGIALGVRDSKAETVSELKRDLDHICHV